jgi:Flp pilus assembly protein TadG
VSWIRLKNAKGQSAIEFVLVAPLLFFIFLGIIQVAYMSYVSFAVQRAALAIARAATVGSKDDSTSFKLQLAISLLPIVHLNQKTLLTILASKYTITPSPDNQRITAQVQYPMPIWVPLVGGVFGEPLVSSFDYNNTPEGQAIKTAFQLFGKQPPDLSFSGVHMPVVWMNYEASTFNEAYGR